MKRMLFNATHQEELRVAIVDGQKLVDLDIESSIRHEKKGNIYKGVVTRVEPSLEAAFVDYGAERQGFLPLKEISRAFFTDYSASTPMAQVRIQDVIKEDQQLLVQVEKDERGNKGAALTTFISLAGRFLVLMPNNPKGGGISRRIEGEERAELRDAMARLDVPNEHALIARTAGIGKTFEELQWDLDYLLQLWNAIHTAGEERAAPFLVFQESNLVVRAIRDYLRSDITEIIIDDAEIFERASKFMSQVMPQNLSKLKRYEDSVPLFSRFQIEHQIESAFSRNIRLASGGALVIDHTEALVTIDVNSARATKGADIEETALQTNLEAVDEIARQLRIRDLGGLIVIDLIDMTSGRNQRTVESRLIDALKSDRARVQVGRISRFGLLEMSRQRLRSSLGESNYTVCPRCDGTGHIRGVPSAALSLLRILQEEALKENTEAIHAHLPVATATYLLNEKRQEINLVENRLGTRIYVIPTPTLETPHFQIKRLRSEDLVNAPELPSYEINMEEDEPELTPDSVRKPSTEDPAVDHQQLRTPAPPIMVAPPPPTPSSPGLIRRLWTAIVGTGESTAIPAEAATPQPQDHPPRRRPQQRRQPQRQGRGDDSRRTKAKSTRGSQPKRQQTTKAQTGKPTAKPKSPGGSQSAEEGARSSGSRPRRGRGNRGRPSNGDGNGADKKNVPDQRHGKRRTESTQQRPARAGDDPQTASAQAPSAAPAASGAATGAATPVEHDSTHSQAPKTAGRPNTALDTNSTDVKDTVTTTSGVQGENTPSSSHQVPSNTD